jgi:hypothetical protein
VNGQFFAIQKSQTLDNDKRRQIVDSCKTHFRRPVSGLAGMLLVAGLIGGLPAPVALAQAAPPVQTQGGIEYVTGGIGSDEAQAMKVLAPEYPLELLFVATEADGRGVYLADNKVEIRAGGKTVLQVTSGGPYLLAKLPPGHYAITADYEGKAKTQAVDIAAGKHARIVFSW